MNSRDFKTLLLFVVVLVFIGTGINGFKRENFGEVFIRAAGSLLAVVIYNYYTDTQSFDIN